MAPSRHAPNDYLSNVWSIISLSPKSVGGGGVGGRSRGSGVVYHTSTGQYIGVATFFFFTLESGLKLDEKAIENGLEGQKFLVVCLFWGGCHHPKWGWQEN